ncbi:hypothetical protein ACWDRB_62940 [Nonomuraea sp. NPDC003707]
MSIYCTRLSADGKDELPRPIAYLGSHVRIADDPWRYGSIDTAHIPDWCHIDADAGDTSTWRPVPYLRLGVNAYDEAHSGTEVRATVVLDEQLVRALRDDLTHWLENSEDRA